MRRSFLSPNSCIPHLPLHTLASPSQIVSHDSAFLDAVADHLWVVVPEAADLVGSGASYSDYRAAEALAREQHVAAYESQQKRHKKLTAAAGRLRAASARGERAEAPDRDKLQVWWLDGRGGRGCFPSSHGGIRHCLSSSASGRRGLLKEAVPTGGVFLHVITTNCCLPCSRTIFVATEPGGRVARRRRSRSCVTRNRSLRGYAEQEVAFFFVCVCFLRDRLSAVVAHFKFSVFSPRLPNPPPPPHIYPLRRQLVDRAVLEIEIDPVGAGGDAAIILSEVVLGHSPDTPLPLAPVDLRVDFGERVAIVGFNGVGKSTLLKTVTGAIEPVRVAGRVFGGFRPVGSKVCVLSATAALARQTPSLRLCLAAWRRRVHCASCKSET